MGSVTARSCGHFLPARCSPSVSRRLAWERPIVKNMDATMDWHGFGGADDVVCAPSKHWAVARELGQGSVPEAVQGAAGDDCAAEEALSCLRVLHAAR